MKIMGIINVTPDSFAEHDADHAAALEHAERLLAEGADIIDVGGESTRPGAGRVSASEQMRRVIPVIAELHRRHMDLVISVDTTSGEVAAKAAEAGATMLNDISMLRDDPALADAAAKYGCELVLNHSRGTPEDMRDFAVYRDLAGEVCAELEAAKREAIRRGVPEEKIIVDPGIGFAKTAEQSMEIMRKIDRLRPLGRILAGPSRKSFLGGNDRLGGTIGAAVFLASRGIDILRVHDVAAVKSALDIWKSLNGGNERSRRGEEK